MGMLEPGVRAGSPVRRNRRVAVGVLLGGCALFNINSGCLIFSRTVFDRVLWPSGTVTHAGTLPRRVVLPSRLLRRRGPPAGIRQAHPRTGLLTDGVLIASL